ncbi:MAG: hypothetical protein ABI684_10915 [Nitrospirota bacterium]
MTMQMIYHGSIMRSARSLFPTLYLVIAIVICSLMPLASPAAWADDADDFRIWGNVKARGRSHLSDATQE